MYQISPKEMYPLTSIFTTSPLCTCTTPRRVAFMATHASSYTPKLWSNSTSRAGAAFQESQCTEVLGRAPCPWSSSCNWARSTFFRTPESQCVLFVSLDTALDHCPNLLISLCRVHLDDPGNCWNHVKLLLKYGLIVFQIA
jgi:hypothetical protein